MSGLLFLAAVTGFVVVAYWAYLNDEPGPDAGTRGILGMTGDVDPPEKRALGWRRLEPPAGDEQSDDRGPQPSWRRFQSEARRKPKPPQS